MASNLYNKITLPAIGGTSVAPPKTYKGFSTVSTNTENFALYDFDLIKQDLLNHFYVRQGERLMNPTFGTIIWDLLYEPLTETIKDLILQNVNEIINFDPRVQAGNVVVLPYDTGLQIQYTLKYTQYNLQETIQLKFDQANGLLVQ
jgi:phage baseplate assembly protein W